MMKWNRLKNAFISPWSRLVWLASPGTPSSLTSCAPAAPTASWRSGISGWRTTRWLFSPPTRSRSVRWDTISLCSHFPSTRAIYLNCLNLWINFCLNSPADPRLAANCFKMGPILPLEIRPRNLISCSHRSICSLPKMLPRKKLNLCGSLVGLTTISSSLKGRTQKRLEL